MANTKLTGVRVDPALIEAAQRKAGLEGHTPSTVIRWALAVLAGVDPVRATDVHRGPRREVREA